MSLSFSGKHDSLCTCSFVHDQGSALTLAGALRCRSEPGIKSGGAGFQAPKSPWEKDKAPCASHLSWGLLIPVIFCLNEGTAEEEISGVLGPCGFLLTGKQGEISITACHSSTGHSVHQVLKLIWGDFWALSFQGSEVGGEEAPSTGKFLGGCRVPPTLCPTQGYRVLGQLPGSFTSEPGVGPFWGRTSRDFWAQPSA